MAIDFAATAQHALGNLEQLLHEWLPGGRREGHEYKALNPTRADKNIGSFCINLDTGVWQDFATSDKGGDAISLYAYLHHLTQSAAAHAVAQRIGLLDGGQQSIPAPPRKTTSQSSRWRAITPVPVEAEAPPKAHWILGRPVATWCYRDSTGAPLHWVYRFAPRDSEKAILPCLWARDEESGAFGWKWKALPAPRPLYGLELLAQAPARPILLVEGEKCADAARTGLGERYIVMTWSGGAKAHGKTDWTPLANRRVFIWPDCDAQLDQQGHLLPEARQPGMAAAQQIAQRLAQQGCSVTMATIPKAGSKPDGWDVADAIADRMPIDDLIRIVESAASSAGSHGAAAGVPAAGAGPGSGVGLILDRRGHPIVNIHNVAQILSVHPDWTGVIAFDAFAGRVVKRKGPPFPTEADHWSDIDDSRTAAWLEHSGLIRVHSSLVAEAVEMVSRAAAFHPVRDYLGSLTWDGKPRLDTWLIDYAGAADRAYTRKVCCYFPLGIVSRVMRPGCKFDYMLVLEGEQGQRKSACLQVLGGPWFGDTDLHIGDKDSMALLQGKLVYEIAELDSFARIEATRQKSFISRQVDEVRPPYGRRVQQWPRQVVFAGTTNQWEWNKDATGGRRFWSIRTGDIDTDGLALVRGQLFAEAFARYKAGERNYPTAAEQRELFTPEQEARLQPDALDERLESWMTGLPREQFTLYEALHDGLSLHPSQITTQINQRVGAGLHRLGCRKVEQRNAKPRFVYLRPGAATASEPHTDATPATADVPD